MATDEETKNSAKERSIPVSDKAERLAANSLSLSAHLISASSVVVNCGKGMPKSLSALFKIALF